MKGEIEVANFIVDHNLPLSLAGPLVELIKRIDPKVAGKINMSRTKCTNLIKRVIAPTYRSSAVEAIRKSPYSLLAYESTDVARCLCQDTY